MPDTFEAVENARHHGECTDAFQQRPCLPGEFRRAKLVTGLCERQHVFCKYTELPDV
jgi:hypothetical protein